VNVQCLLEAGFGERIGSTTSTTTTTTNPGEANSSSRGYLSLANNHVLDWCVQGMEETVSTLEAAGIAFAGAGRRKEEAERPARLILGERGEYEVHVYSFSDHPGEWAGVGGFNFIDYTAQSRERMKRIISTTYSSTLPSPSSINANTNTNTTPATPALRIVSLHCGPNYTPTHHPSPHLTSLTHYLIDDCGVDIIVNHSAHHILGAEIYHSKLILYGLGDFVDDYAVLPEWRNDLSGAWKVSVSVQPVPDTAEGASTPIDESGVREGEAGGAGKLRVTKLEMFPNCIQSFSAHLLNKSDEDHIWIQKRFREMCEKLGTRVEEELGEDGQIVVDILSQRQ
jgi:hypothetical protein